MYMYTYVCIHMHTMFRADRNGNGGGVLIYVREDIPCRQLTGHQLDKSLEEICLEINLRKSKWFLFGGIIMRNPISMLS